MASMEFGLPLMFLHLKYDVSILLLKCWQIQQSVIPPNQSSFHAIHRYCFTWIHEQIIECNKFSGPCLVFLLLVTCQVCPSTKSDDWLYSSTVSPNPGVHAYEQVFEWVRLLIDFVNHISQCSEEIAQHYVVGRVLLLIWCNWDQVTFRGMSLSTYLLLELWFSKVTLWFELWNRKTWPKLFMIP